MAQGWQLSIGGARYDEANSIVETIDGGFLSVGFSESYGQDGDLDVFAVRTDIDGKVLWQEVYDLGFMEHGFDVLAEADGSFLIAGDISTTAADPLNVLLMKVSKEGKPLWVQRYQAAAREVGKSVVRAAGGGYLIAGSTQATANGNADILVIRVDDKGKLLWRKTLGGSGDDNAVSAVALRDGFVVAGNSDNPKGVDSDIVLYRLDLNGQQVWAQPVRISTEEPDEVRDMILTANGHLVIAGSAGFNSDAYLARLDTAGKIIWETKIGGKLGDVANAVQELPDGSLVITGQSEVTEINPDMLIAGFNADGKELWRSLIGEDQISEEGRQLVRTNEGKYAIVGLRSGVFAAQLNDMILVKTDDRGNIITNYVSGRVYRDADQGCNGYDLTRDTPLKDWLVRVSNGEKTYYGTTDDQGRYRIRVDTGKYNVTLLPVNSYWKSCAEEGVEVEMTAFYDSTTVNFPVLPQQNCPYLEVDVSTPFLAPCTNVVYTVAYCNIGTTTARGAYVEVTLDDEIAFVNASIPVARREGNVFTFNLGDLASTACGQFEINTSLACSGIAEGQAGMVSARIFPDTLCETPNPNWDQSSIVVSGKCEPGRDKPVAFTIRNVGKGNMIQARRTIVTQDDLILLQGSYDLDAGEDTLIQLPVDRAKVSTYRLIAEQSEFHPGRSFPTAFLEGCVETGGDYKTGFVTVFPENDLDPNISIDVQEIVGTHGSVALRGYPKGYRDSALIANRTDLTYTIFFRNVGTDTINRLVIRDTLSPHLDITTVIPGSSNLPYEFEIYDNGILKITFSDIELLPGGSVGDPASYGFVKFRVSQKLNNPVGTIIENHAAVFFDYQAPVRSNQVRYFVGDFPSYLEVITNNEQVFWSGVKIKVYPNPFIEAVSFELEGYPFKEVILKVFDASGRLMSTSRQNGNSIMYYRNGLPSGMYFYRLESEGQLINSGKLLVR